MKINLLKMKRFCEKKTIGKKNEMSVFKLKHNEKCRPTTQRRQISPDDICHIGPLFDIIF